ncbi:hypothetical protein GCM10009801_46370 [Streptomyces albiaxialis]|uniref:DUF4232 domain-containing protein n=1 Tax=Streptomyces albiaxialis TaxID=329523 RepID=A0ABN2W6C8_9ACTN
MRKSFIRATALAATAFAAFSLTACGSSGGDNASGGKEKKINSVNVGAKSAAGKGVEQTCGANDLSWTVRSKTQAGGYSEVMVKANEGITCWLPAELPSVRYNPSDGSGFIVARGVEQEGPKAIKLSGDTVAYAGVSPKSTNNNDGKEATEFRIKVSDNDTAYERTIQVGPETVDEPIVTNWHLDPQDAVPGIY